MTRTVERSIPNHFPQCAGCETRQSALVQILAEMEIALQLPPDEVDAINVDTACSPRPGSGNSGIAYSLTIESSLLVVEQSRKKIQSFHRTPLEPKTKKKKATILCPGLAAASRKG